MICPHCNEPAPDTNYRCPNCRKVLQPERALTDFEELHKKTSKRSSFNINILIIAVIVMALAFFTYTVFFKGDENIKSDRVSESPKKPGTDTRSSKFSEMFKGIGEEEKENQAPDISADTGMDAGGDSEIADSSAGEEADVGYVINLANPGEEVYIEDYVQGGKTTIFDFYSEYCPPCRKISPWLQELDSKRDDILVFKVDINRKGVRGIDWRSPIVKQFNLKSIPHFIIYDSTGQRTHEGRTAYTRVVELLRSEGIVR